MSTAFPEAFDPDTEEGSHFELIPAGDYLAMITEASVAPPKSGDGQMLSLRWVIIEGEYENRTVFQSIVFLHSSEQAQRFGRQRLKDLCDAMGITGAVTDAEIFLNRPVRIRIGIEKDKGGVYEDRNGVKRVMPPDGPPATPAPAPKPAAAVKPAAIAAKATGGSPPWARGRAS